MLTGFMIPKHYLLDVFEWNKPLASFDSGKWLCWWDHHSGCLRKQCQTSHLSHGTLMQLYWRLPPSIRPNSPTEKNFLLVSQNIRRSSLLPSMCKAQIGLFFFSCTATVYTNAGINWCTLFEYAAWSGMDVGMNSKVLDDLLCQVTC